MFSCGQRNKQCSAARLRGFSGNRLPQLVHKPPVHPSASGKPFYLHFPAHRLFLRLESLIPHKTHWPPGLRVLRPAPRIVRLHPFFPGRSSIRGRRSRPNIPEDMCSSCYSPFHGDTGTRLYPAPTFPCSLTLYMLCKRQWDHGIHHRSPKA